MEACGELWAMLFRNGEVHAQKELIAASECHLGTGLDVRLGEASLQRGSALGQAGTIRWDLSFSENEPLLLLPPRLYEAPFPKAKVLVGSPGARFGGSLWFENEEISLEGFVGSQNHNWGSEHTSEYAWGQVAGFDEAPDAFLEVSTARIQLGALQTPWLTPIVFRENGRELRLSALWRAIKNHGRYDPLTLRWNFSGESSEGKIRGTIEAPPEAFLAIPYENPPGGTKHCLNSKIADAEIHIEWQGKVRTLRSPGAAFEILGDAGMKREPGIRFIDLPSPRSFL